MAKHPMQPVIVDDHGVHRFKRNAIVDYLLDWCTAKARPDRPEFQRPDLNLNEPPSLNELACMDFSREDREQFAQLIGYSVSGFGELSYVSDATYEKGMAESEKITAAAKRKKAVSRKRTK